MFPAFTAAHAWVAGAARGDPARSARAALARTVDRWSYALLLAVPATMLLTRGTPAWRHALGAVFVAVLFGKVALLVATLYRVAVAPGEPGGPDPPALGRQLGLAAGLLHLLLTPYVVAAVSTAGDEHVYLLNVHSLLVDGDVDIRDNVARGDWKAFYWGRPAPWSASFIGFPALLLPGYAAFAALLPHPLAGRLGATLTVALFATLLGVQLYRLCRELGASRPAAFWTWLTLGLSVPVLVGAGHVYPEIPAAWAALAGVRALLRLPADRRALPLVLALAAGLVLLKDRYAPMALGLVLWAVARLAGSRRRAAGVLLLGVALVAALALARVGPLPEILPNLRTLQHRLGLAWHPLMTRAVLGLFLDQEFGLLFYGPHWALALPGAVWLLRRRPWPALGLLAVVAFQVLAIVRFRWDQWDAGWTPPPRFLLAVALLLGPFVAEAFDRGRGRLLAVFNTVGLAWSGVLAVGLSVVPFWRYNDLDGRSTLVQLAGRWLELDLARFVPSLRAPTRWTWIALWILAALALAALVAAARRRQAPGPGWGVGAVVLRPVPAAALLGGIALAWLAAAALVPTWSLEAEAMQRSGGIGFGSFQNQPVLWVLHRDGELSERIVTWPGTLEILVLAGGFTTTGARPQLTVLLDETIVASWPLTAGRNHWTRRVYRVQTPTGFGRPTLTLRVSGLLDDRRGRRVQHAFLDRVELRRP
jgi:hypothetical protein